MGVDRQDLRQLLYGAIVGDVALLGGLLRLFQAWSFSRMVSSSLRGTLPEWTCLAFSSSCLRTPFSAAATILSRSWFLRSSS